MEAAIRRPFRGYFRIAASAAAAVDVRAAGRYSRRRFTLLVLSPRKPIAMEVLVYAYPAHVSISGLDDAVLGHDSSRAAKPNFFHGKHRGPFAGSALDQIHWHSPR